MANHNAALVPFGSCCIPARNVNRDTWKPTKNAPHLFLSVQREGLLLCTFLASALGFTCDIMDASDADAPVVTPYVGSKMESPAPPSLPRQPSPPPPQSSLNSPPATSSIPPDSSTAGTDPTKLSTAERIKLSVAALITRRDSSTPAADHFTVLPGDSPISRAESFAVQQNNPDQHSRLDQQGHAIRHGLSSDSEKQWGMEGLLRSKAGTAGGAAADAKRKLSAHLGLSAKRGEEGGEQQQQSCEYVAMNTPCESPVASGGGVDQEVSPTLSATCKQPNCSATSNSHWLACTINRRVA